MILSDFDQIARQGRAAAFSDVQRIVDAARDGDVHHIDGALIRALDDLATDGRTEYAGATVYRASDGTFGVARGNMVTFEETALGALLEAECTAKPCIPLERMNGWRAEA